MVTVFGKLTKIISIRPRIVNEPDVTKHEHSPRLKLDVKNSALREEEINLSIQIFNQSKHSLMVTQIKEGYVDFVHLTKNPPKYLDSSTVEFYSEEKKDEQYGIFYRLPLAEMAGYLNSNSPTSKEWASYEKTEQLALEILENSGGEISITHVNIKKISNNDYKSDLDGLVQKNPSLFSSFEVLLDRKETPTGIFLISERGKIDDFLDPGVLRDFLYCRNDPLSFLLDVTESQRVDKTTKDLAWAEINKNFSSEDSLKDNKYNGFEYWWKEGKPFNEKSESIVSDSKNLSLEKSKFLELEDPGFDRE